MIESLFLSFLSSFFIQQTWRHHLFLFAFGEGMTSLPLSYRFHSTAGITIPGGDGIGAGVIVAVVLVVSGVLFLAMGCRKVQPAETVDE